MKDLILLLTSGVPLMDALDQLKHNASYGKKMAAVQGLLQHGTPIPSAFGCFFSWWCPNPFSNLTVPVEAVLFLTSCQHVIDQRKQTCRKMLSLLLYPCGVLCFGTAMVIGLNSTMPQTSALSNGMLVGFTALFAGLGVALAVVAISGVRIQSVDVLDSCYLLLDQGHPLGVVLGALTFQTPLASKWQAVVRDSSDCLSFVDAFATHFYLPEAIQLSLKMHEGTGSITQGLALSIPYLRLRQNTEFKAKCQLIQMVLYGVIVGLIIMMLQLIYAPVLEQMGDFSS